MSMKSLFLAIEWNRISRFISQVENHDIRKPITRN